MVGRFDGPEEARRYVDELLPAFQPGEPFSAEWQQLLAEQGIALEGESVSPEVMTAVGPVVLLQTRMAEDDDFPALRTLLWKRGGRSILTGIHIHEDLVLAAGLGLPDGADLDAARAHLAADGLGDFRRRGSALFGVVGTDQKPLPELLSGITTAAGELGATLGAELVSLRAPVEMPALLAAPAPADQPQWLWASFWTAEAAEKAARGVEGRFTLADRYLLVTAPRISPRLGWFLQSHGGSTELLFGPRLRLVATFSRPRNEGPTTDEVAACLRPRLGPGDTMETSEPWTGSAALVETSAPGEALLALLATGSELSTRSWIDIEPAPDRLVHALGRVARDLRRR
jgi:hypothetical protein